MNGWLMLWLGMAVFAPIAWTIVVLVERLTDRPDLHNRRIRKIRGFVFDGLGLFLMVIVFLGIGAVGLLGTLGWLVAWGFGS